MWQEEEGKQKRVNMEISKEGTKFFVGQSYYRPQGSLLPEAMGEWTNQCQPHSDSLVMRSLLVNCNKFW